MAFHGEILNFTVGPQCTMQKEASNIKLNKFAMAKKYRFPL